MHSIFLFFWMGILDGRSAELTQDIYIHAYAYVHIRMYMYICVQDRNDAWSTLCIATQMCSPCRRGKLPTRQEKKKKKKEDACARW